jgi:hypothetical protein
VRSRAILKFSAASAGNEPDVLADELLTAFTDAITRAGARLAHKVDPTNPEHQRSILRAAGGSMAILASAARLAGLSDEQAAAIVKSGFDSKFSVDLPLTKDVPS